MNSSEYELIVIGGGPNGLACAIEAQKRGIKTMVLEKGTIAESIRRYPYQMTFFSTADNIAIGNVPFTINTPKATREEALNYYRKVVEFYQLPIKLYCKVESVKKEDQLFMILTGAGESFKADNVVISTGYFDFPRRLNIPGEDLPHVKHYYDEPYAYVHQQVVIIGGGNSAVEAALSLYRHGADVSLMVRKEGMKKTAKYWLIPDLLNRIKEGKIRAYYHYETIRIEEGCLYARDLVNQQEVGIPAEFVFVLTGYLPDVSFMQQAGIRIKPGTLEPGFNQETFETDVPGLYVAGTVTAGIHTEKVFIENGRLHGRFIVDHILKRKAGKLQESFSLQDRPGRP
ncbi:MAG: YpdA family putative bacillithiol disulfide reductase [Cyclobacteriaceae bacterium]|nr:YpdA family putative bacillithiol disulfide reductase [Cyclobacteriaceae bacterium]